jgi:hypothetical protein
MKTNKMNYAAIIVLSSVLSSVMSSNPALSQGTNGASNTTQQIPRGYKGGAFTKLQQLPSNFPLPAYTSNVISADYSEQARKTGKSNFNAFIRTSDNPAVPFQFYKSAVAANTRFELAKNVPEHLEGQGREYYYIVAQNESERLSIVCSRMPKDNATTVAITVFQK